MSQERAVVVDEQDARTGGRHGSSGSRSIVCSRPGPVNRADSRVVVARCGEAAAVQRDKIGPCAHAGRGLPGGGRPAGRGHPVSPRSAPARCWSGSTPAASAAPTSRRSRRGSCPAPRIFGHEIAGTVARRAPRVRGSGRATASSCTTTSPAGRASTAARGLRAVRGLQAQRDHRGVRGRGRRLRRVREGASTGSWSAARSPSRTACSPEEAAFVEPVNTCLKAVRKAGVAKGQTVLVVGQGPIGLHPDAALPLGGGGGARHRHAARPPGDEPRALGAAAALDAPRATSPREVRALTGRPRRRRGRSWPPSARPPSRQAIDATRPGRPYHGVRRHLPGRDGRGGPRGPRARPRRRSSRRTARPWTSRTWPRSSSSAARSACGSW